VKPALPSRSSRSRFRSGDLVELRTPSEILATLDEHGCLAGLPFMPEMLRFFGKRFRVLAQAERVCDTHRYDGALRIPDAVLLDEPRCAGVAHGGCQAACRLYWKEAWLRPASLTADQVRADRDEEGLKDLGRVA
jgi:hypothetical protein